jgi:urea transport system permease protein
MIRALLAAVVLCLSAPIVLAQGLQDLLQQNAEQVAEPSRRTVGEVLDVLVQSGLPEVPGFLERWQSREVFLRTADGLFFFATETDGGYDLFDIETGEPAGNVARSEMKALIPNAGVRGVIGTALIEFQLNDPDLARRTAAVVAIMRNPSEEMLEPLRESIVTETDPDLQLRKVRVERLLTASFDPDPAMRVEAIGALATDTSVEARAVLNRMVTTRMGVAAELPEDANIRAVLEPGSDVLSREAAYAMLVDEGLAPARVSQAEIRTALEAAVADGTITDVAGLGSIAAREAAYVGIAGDRGLPPLVTEAGVDAALAAHVFFVAYTERDAAITEAAEAALEGSRLRVGAWQFADITLDALSLASIYFLAAIGLAITFGVMGVINMAHGEFIMMGAYTAYVVQLFVPDYTLSLLIALPLAFAVTFGAGVVMERLVIRWLYHRPLETLLATFGISIALQQLAKNIFGTQARPLTAPEWLSGAWQYNDVLGISYIRIAIFVLALVFLVILLFVLKRTRLGLEVRAVTQNPGMAASMGINPDRINMLTFGLGSGIAGVAGVAIGLYAQVTSEMGANYIVQSFMTVVVGGVGNVWGTLAGATLIGFLQKGIEWFNPSNTLAAQTFMILFIIIFIQFRPRGIVALKGRAAGA